MFHDGTDSDGGRGIGEPKGCGGELDTSKGGGGGNGRGGSYSSMIEVHYVISTLLYCGKGV